MPLNCTDATFRSFETQVLPEAMQATRDRVRQFAADGRFELFKTTTKYDGKEGREQHHFPTVEKLAV
jgi:hypothetical protein